MILFLTELMLLQYIKQELGILILVAGGSGSAYTRIDGTTGYLTWYAPYATEGDLPSATDQHGMFAHVHGTGKGYFAHAAAWVKLVDYNDGISALTDVDTTVNGGPSDGQVLKWNDSNSKWEPANDQQSGGGGGGGAGVPAGSGKQGGSNGSYNSGGNGGSGNGCGSNSGGKGGNPGQNASGGNSGSNGNSGYYIDGASYVYSWVATGDRRGRSGN